MKNKILSIAFLLMLFSSMAFATTTVVVNDPNGAESFNRQQVGEVTIDFNLSSDGDSVPSYLVDINYSVSDTEGTGSVIVNDENTETSSLITCAAGDFNVTRNCTLTWGMGSVPNNSYYILIAADFNSTEEGFDASDATFAITSSYVPTYVGNDMGPIFIDLFGIVFAALTENIGTIVILIIIGIIAFIGRDSLKEIIRAIIDMGS